MAKRKRLKSGFDKSKGEFRSKTQLKREVVKNPKVKKSKSKK